MSRTIYLLVFDDPYERDVETDIRDAWPTRESAEAARLEGQRRVSSVDPGGVRGFNIVEVTLHER